MTTDFLLDHHVTAGRFIRHGNDGSVTAFFVQFGHDGHLVGLVLICPFGVRQRFVLLHFIDGRLVASVGDGGLAHHLVHGLAKVELRFGCSIEAAF